MKRITFEISDDLNTKVQLLFYKRLIPHVKQKFSCVKKNFYKPYSYLKNLENSTKKNLKGKIN